MTAVAISVIIVNWNGRALLARCLAALLPTLTADDQVIVVDNGSTDRTAEVAIEQEVEGIVQGAIEGDLGRRISAEGKEGFFRRLTDSLNRFLGTTQAGITDVGHALAKLAEGDLTSTIEKFLRRHGR